jgi:flagellar motor switch protein FliN/FliY
VPDPVNTPSLEVMESDDGTESNSPASDALMETPEGTSTALSEDVPFDESNLDLVLDVELNALLRFGQRQLTLREVLGLKCGSVVELDRRVDEPVELLIDDRVIARGEAAIVDGNYGLRVTEIMRSGAGELATRK